MIRRVICLLRRHHECHRPQWIKGRARLVCVDCGWTSAGVPVAKPAERRRPVITRTRRHLIPALISANFDLARKRRQGLA